jgi:hypothetical protein
MGHGAIRDRGCVVGDRADSSRARPRDGADLEERGVEATGSARMKTEDGADLSRYCSR